jgi:Helix-turn-helix domain
MASDQVPIYVRMSAVEAARLDTAANATGRSKRQLVEDAVREHLSDEGLVVGRVSLHEAAPEVLTLEEAAALLRVEPESLSAEATAAKVPGRQLGQEWRFSRVALLEWLGGDAGAAQLR